MGFIFSRWLCLTCASTDCLYFAKLQREPSRSTSQMAWKRDSPQGEPHLALPAGGLLRGQPGESSPRLSSQLQRKMVHVTIIVWERIREARSVSRFRSFSKNSKERQGKYFEPNTPKLKMLMLHSFKKKTMFDPRSCLLVSRFPSFQSFSPPTATFTFRKKNSSNQVTSVILFTIGRRRGKRLS